MQRGGLVDSIGFRFKGGLDINKLVDTLMRTLPVDCVIYTTDLVGGDDSVYILLFIKGVCD